MGIDPAEYRARQARLAAALAAAGYRGAVVVSRGGFTVDRAADVLYLTGHYQAYVYLPDEPPHWSGRAHTIFLLRADGENCLLLSTPEYDAARIVADRFAHGPDFLAETVARLRAFGLAGGRIALIGADVLPARMWRRLQAALPGADFEDADELLAAPRRIKSAAERELIRRATAVNRRAVTAFAESLAPGRRESDAVAAAQAVATAEGAGVYYAAASSGEMSWAYASSPQPGFSQRLLRAGDLVRLDLCIVVDGYYSDFGRTFVVGEPSSEQRRLLETLHAALDRTIAAIRPGVRAAEVVAAGDRGLAELGVALDRPAQPGEIAAGYPAHWGHGLGLGWERPWMVVDETLTIEENMHLAIERAIALEGVGTVAAEQNLLVGREGVELLTAGPSGVWS
jgi:Xaa-Pro aminopeptidase